MDEKLEQQIEQAIRENLPQQVVRMAEGRIVYLENGITNLQKQVVALEQEKMALQLKLTKAGDLDEREQQVLEAERNLAVTDLTMQLGAEQRITKSYNEFIGLLVRNPVVKRSVLNDFSNYPTGDGYNAQTGQSFRRYENVIASSEVSETTE